MTLVKLWVGRTINWLMHFGDFNISLTRNVVYVFQIRYLNKCPLLMVRQNITQPITIVIDAWTKYDSLKHNIHSPKKFRDKRECIKIYTSSTITHDLCRTWHFLICQSITNQQGKIVNESNEFIQGMVSIKENKITILFGFGVIISFISHDCVKNLAPPIFQKD